MASTGALYPSAEGKRLSPFISDAERGQLWIVLVSFSRRMIGLCRRRRRRSAGRCTCSRGKHLLASNFLLCNIIFSGFFLLACWLVAMRIIPACLRDVFSVGACGLIFAHKRSRRHHSTLCGLISPRRSMRPPFVVRDCPSH